VTSLPGNPSWADGWLDANVVIRHLTGDPPDMAADAGRLMREAEEGRITLHLHPITVAETVWVLSRGYGFDRQAVAGAVRSFLRARGIRCEASDMVISALDDYESLNVDFMDALLARRAAASSAPLCYTFDTRHFRRLRVTSRRPGRP